ncbi:GNAT family N-acetyltransferase [Brucella sp. TWI432]
MKLSIVNSCNNYQSYRAARVKSLFNVEDGSRFELTADLPIEDMPWGIGLIVGPSGSGKTSMGREIFAADRFAKFDWPHNEPIIDAIARDGDFNHATAALSSVGLGSVPSWLRPYHVLSNGEQFRADLARVVCDRPEEIVIDEFTSVVDRQIAKIGALAFGKAWRRAGGRAVLLSCHYDIIDWLDPDWVFDTATGEFTGRCHRQRPKIEVEIQETNWQWWPYFEPHHYLKMPHMIAATCYVAFVDGEPVAHLGVSTRPGLVEARACRLVVMPEWQGAGVGMRFLNAVCAAWRRGENRYGKPMPTLFHTSHPGLASALRRDPLWTQTSGVLHGGSARHLTTKKGLYGGHFRAVQGFRYIEGIDIRE